MTSRAPSASCRSSASMICAWSTERALAHLLGVEVGLDARPELALALLPEPLHHERERAVAGGRGDAHVEFAVGGVALGEVVGEFAHAHDRLAQRSDVGLLDGPRGERRDLAFDQTPGGKQLERTRAFVDQSDDLRRARLRHEDAGADAHFDATRDLERDDRLAHRRARHAEQRRELALGGQARAGGKFAVVDQGGDLAGDLPVEPQRFDRMQGHWILVSDRGCGRRAESGLGAVRVLPPRDCTRGEAVLVKWSNHRTRIAPEGDAPARRRSFTFCGLRASATKCPDLPPDFSSRRTSSMRMPRSAALHMS